MSVVIASKKAYSGTATPSDLNVETTIVELGPETDDYIVEGYMDLSQLQSGDSVKVCEYIAVDGVNYQRFLCVEYSGPVENPVVRFHSKTLLKAVSYTHLTLPTN